jgi:hypothetical protein
MELSGQLHVPIALPPFPLGRNLGEQSRSGSVDDNENSSLVYAMCSLPFYRVVAAVTIASWILYVGYTLRCQKDFILDRIGPL